MFSSFLALAAAPLLMNVQASLGCTDKKYDNTKIVVNVTHEPVIISRERTLYELNKDLGGELYRRKRESKQEYYLNEDIRTNDEWIIGGTGHGDIDTQTNVEFLAISQGKKAENSCILFKEVTVDITYQTMMTIAKEFTEGGCEYNAVLEHEKTRHDAYTQVVDTVAKKLESDLPAIIDSYEMGYVPSVRLGSAYRQLEKSVRNSVDKYQEHMVSMMQQYNEIVDSPEALKKLATNCEKQRIQEMKEESEHEKGKEEDPHPPGSLGSYLKDFRKEQK